MTYDTFDLKKPLMRRCVLLERRHFTLATILSALGGVGS